MIEQARHGNWKHGGTNRGIATPTYRVWKHMIARCNSPTDKDFGAYGGRGIAVCVRWRSFANFLADMRQRPSGLELDRIDNNKGYDPTNCRWVDRRAQCRNKRNNRLITFNGETLCLSAWAERVGVHPATLRWRLRVWSLRSALTAMKEMRHGQEEPPRRTKRKKAHRSAA